MGVAVSKPLGCPPLPKLASARQAVQLSRTAKLPLNYRPTNMHSSKQLPRKLLLPRKQLPEKLLLPRKQVPVIHRPLKRQGPQATSTKTMLPDVTPLVQQPRLGWLTLTLVLVLLTLTLVLLSLGDLTMVQVGQPSSSCPEHQTSRLTRKSMQQKQEQRQLFVRLTTSSTGTTVASCPLYLAVLLRCYGVEPAMIHVGFIGA